MSDTHYYDAGRLFLETRRRINADAVIYSPDLTKSQIKTLNDNNISCSKVDSEEFRLKMQSLKFDFIIEQIKLDTNNKYKGFSFVDFDTFFINDWEKIFDKYEFDFGITIRNTMVSKKVLRAFTNGGVMFAKHSSLGLLEFARKTIIHGRNSDLEEYDIIWKTLENGRPAHKTHSRNVHRWWCDQVFLSSLAMRFFKTNGYQKIGIEPKIFKFKDFKIALFSCDNYNVVESEPKITNEKNVYIRHLKDVGRSILNLKKTKEKL